MTNYSYYPLIMSRLSTIFVVLIISACGSVIPTVEPTIIKGAPSEQLTVEIETTPTVSLEKYFELLSQADKLMDEEKFQNTDIVEHQKEIQEVCGTS